MLCRCCKNREESYRGLCKVCSYTTRNKQKMLDVVDWKIWSNEEIELLLEYILYCKIEVVNELCDVLLQKSLAQIIDIITTLHIGGRTPLRVSLNCFSCGQKLIRPIGYFYHERVYCSYECRDKYRTECLSGENSPWYNRINTQCTNCGKNISVIPSLYDSCNEYGDNHNFCSCDCYYEYRSKYYVGEKHPAFGTHLSEEKRLQIKERTAKMVADGKMPQTMTKPHQKVYDLLISNGIECQNEHVLKYHSIDIYVPEHNLMIEIMGDYWHGIPTKYSYELLNKQQLKSVKQDKSKHTYVKKYHNVEILYLWECDIIHNIDLCLALIFEYINNNGILCDYQSYNYTMNENNLSLKKNIVHPFFITQNPYRLQEVDGNTNLEVVLPTPCLEGNNIQSALTL